VLEPGGALAYQEFHPLRWSFGPLDERENVLALTKDDYFADGPFQEPVGDYVLESGAGLGVTSAADSVPNEHVATSWQHGLGQIVTALAQAGLVIERLDEQPHSNGNRPYACMVLGDDRRWRFPDDVARVPLMFGVRARKPR
jgi:hypothetical protein